MLKLIFNLLDILTKKYCYARIEVKPESRF